MRAFEAQRRFCVGTNRQTCFESYREEGKGEECESYTASACAFESPEANEWMRCGSASAFLTRLAGNAMSPSPRP